LLLQKMVSYVTLGAKGSFGDDQHIVPVLGKPNTNTCIFSGRDKTAGTRSMSLLSGVPIFNISVMVVLSKTKK
jgi:hypothetical protein